MPPGRNRLLTSGLIVVAIASAGCGNLYKRRFDNPEARELQKESVSRFPERPIKGEGIREFFNGKVGLIAGSNPRIPSGRAVPVGKDGYYLTAWHVVSGGEYHLSDLVELRPLPKGRTVKTDDYLRWDSYPGRLVWHDAEADLAIVKFDYRPAAIFTLAADKLHKNAAVFSGASGRNSGTLLSSSSLADGIGNGPFATAGRVTKVKKLDHGRILYDSTLVGRGGMSGAAVVNELGDVVGIVIRGRTHAFSAPTTEFSMIPPEEIARIISADRRSRR